MHNTTMNVIIACVMDIIVMVVGVNIVIIINDSVSTIGLNVLITTNIINGTTVQRLFKISSTLIT